MDHFSSFWAESKAWCTALILANLETEFHELLTLARPGAKHDEEMSICSSSPPQTHRGYINSSLLESDLKMSKSHLICRTYMSETSTSWTKQLLKTWQTLAQLTSSSVRNQRTYVVNQYNKHRLEDLLSLNTSRNGVGEVSKRSMSKWKSTCKYRGAHLNRSADFKSISLHKTSGPENATVR